MIKTLVGVLLAVLVSGCATGPSARGQGEELELPEEPRDGGWADRHRIREVKMDTKTWLYDLALSPDDEILAVASGWGIELRHADTLERFQILTEEHGLTTCDDLEWSPDGRYLAAGIRESWDNVVIYEREGGAIRKLRGHRDITLHVLFSPDGELLVTKGNGEKELRIWNVESGELVQEIFVGIETDRGHPHAFAFTPAGDALVVGYVTEKRDADGLVDRHYWIDVVRLNGEIVERVDLSAVPIPPTPGFKPFRTGGAYGFEFCDENHVVVVMPADAYPVFDMRTWEVSRYVRTRNDDGSWLFPLSPLDWKSKPKLGVVCASSLRIYLIRLGTVELITHLDSGGVIHQDDIAGVDISSDGRFLYSGAGNGMVVKWEIGDLVGAKGGK